MKVSVLYSPDCPNWRAAGRRLRAALDLLGLQATGIDFVAVDTDAEVIATGFAGSPTFTVDGMDLFDADRVPAGLTCRVYRTQAGSLAGIPDLTELTAALRTKVAT